MCIGKEKEKEGGSKDEERGVICFECGGLHTSWQKIKIFSKPKINKVSPAIQLLLTGENCTIKIH